MAFPSIAVASLILATDRATIAKSFVSLRRMIFHDLSQNIVQAVELLIRGRLPEEKNPEKVWSFAKPGGGVLEGRKKPNLYFGKVFFSEHVESF